MNAKTKNSLAIGMLWLAGLFVLALLVVFLGYILYKGMPVLSASFIFGNIGGCYKNQFCLS